MRWTAYGRGDPVTLVVHGLGATAGEARIPASGLAGTRVVLTLPGHGTAPDAPPGYWDYARIAADVREVADEVAATRAVGVSLGSGALTRILAEQPDRFAKVALLLPAALDGPRDTRTAAAFGELAAAVAAADADGGAQLHRVLRAEVPEGADVGDHLQQRAAALLRVPEALRALPERYPIDDAAALAAVRAGVLVVGATEDPLHPADTAEATAAAFPDARLELLPSAAPMLTHRARLRALLTEHLR
ncbi:alpha/beta fold hydrolase [Saccharopolyspora montiporae]|uniref:alpha/beta fold hydrolase n=1 Tax=Saccharopolyspora montiporae TaxID=2781240 RepID=UPI00351C3440